MATKTKQLNSGHLSISEKHKLSLHLAEAMFGLPEEELTKLDLLFAERKKLYGNLWGSTKNSKTGNTAKEIQRKIEENTQEITKALAQETRTVTGGWNI